jgi:diaminopimelate decarboxylase
MMEAANVHLRKIYVPEHNERFGKAAAEPGSAFVSGAGFALDEVLCVQEDRQVSRYNCVSWSGRSLQIPEQRHRRHYVKAVVCLHEYPDGQLAIFDGPRCLFRFDARGVQIDEPAPAA